MFRLLDLFCGAGGAAVGYARAGFDIVGVDIAHQRRYPFSFVQADALEYVAAHGAEFDAIHASPPCQAYSGMKAFVRKEYPRLIAPLRSLLIDTGKIYVIENVAGARDEMKNPVTMCGGMFPDIRTYRHRLFESNVQLHPPYVCNGRHNDNTPMAGRGRSDKGFISITSGGIRGVTAAEAKAAMGCEWMSCDEMAESFPPHYTHWLGAQLIAALGGKPESLPEVRLTQGMLL